MSLIRFSISPTTSVSSSPSSSLTSSPLHTIVYSLAKDSFSLSSSSKLLNSSSRTRFSPSLKDDTKKNGWSFTVRSSLDTVGPTAAVGQVTEVTKDTFWPIVKSAGDKIVVLDMYTQWCGPCKVIAPKFKDLSEKHLDVVFLKLDCNQDNKPLAKELGIRVVPTFKILKDSKIVKEVTGAKFDDLVVAIEAVRSS